MKARTAIACLALAACSSGTGHSSRALPPTTMATATISAPVGLAGTYTTFFTGDEVYGPPGHTISSGHGLPMRGSKTLIISDTQIQFAQSTGPQAVSDAFPLGPSYTSTSNRVTIGPDPSCAKNSSPTPGEGVYSYTMTGGILTFKVVTDNCLARAATLTLHHWRRQ